MRRAAFQRRALSLTPLVDVIFLLLLFFMLTSTFEQYGEIELAGTTGGGTAPASGDTQFVRLSAKAVRLGGQEITLDVLATSLREGTVLVSMSDGVDAQRLIDLLAVVRTVPGLRLAVLR